MSVKHRVFTYLINASKARKDICMASALRKFKNWLAEKLTGEDIEYILEDNSRLTIENIDLYEQWNKVKFELSKIKNNKLLRFVEKIKVLNSKDPKDELTAEDRRMYCSRIALLQKELKGILEWQTAIQIEALAKVMFDPTQFKDLSDQHMFRAGNINMASLLIDHIDDIVQEHQSDVEAARKNLEPSSEPLIPTIDTEVMTDQILVDVDNL